MSSITLSSDGNQNVDSQPVIVTVRIRPLNDDEMSTPSKDGGRRSGFRKFGRSTDNLSDPMAWISRGDTIVQTGARKTVSGKSHFTFDAVFDDTVDTKNVYDQTVLGVVKGITEGKHGTVFTYGQTSSGKTYTMQGSGGSRFHTNSEGGVLQLAASDLLRWARRSKFDVIIRASYFEIYNETVRDLLGGLGDDQATRQATTFRKQDSLPVLSIRDDPQNGGVSLNCTQIEVESMETMMAVLHHGNQNRAVAATSMNARSSRSHAIFRITLESRREDVVRGATLNLVDLAGSENSFTADTSSQRKREGGKINQSLLSLSQVIQALSLPDEKRPSYINYRDSKLTRILQPHLSGNAQLAVICCVSPSRDCLEETRSTLRFASRAKLIQCKAHVNESVNASESAEVRKLQEQLLQTRKALEDLTKLHRDTELASVASAQEVKELRRLMLGNDTEVRTLNEMASDESTSDGNNNGSTPRKRRSKRPGGSRFPTIHETKNEAIGQRNENVMGYVNTLDSFQRVTKKRQGERDVASRDSQALPSEVLIMSGAGPDQRYLQTTDQLSQSYAVDMENRARFLEDRLEITEDLVEGLKSEIASARDCIQTLASKNEKLAERGGKYKRRVLQLEDQGQNEYKQQYYLLKYSLYASLFFFLFGFQEAFLVMSFFLWLTLEKYTT